MTVLIVKSNLSQVNRDQWKIPIENLISTIILTLQDMQNEQVRTQWNWSFIVL